MNNIKLLFLIDSIGALISALMYTFVLTQFQGFIGFPLKVLYSLAALAFIYAVYSGVCYLSNTINYRPYLRIIATANTFHCLFTIILIIIYHKQMELLGLLYFLVEISILLTLVFFEFSKSKLKLN